MTMKIYSVHTVNDGKWQVVLHVKEAPDYAYFSEPRPDIRAIVENHYDEAPEALAKLLLDNVLDCEIVEINMLAGTSLRIEKRDGKTA